MPSITWLILAASTMLILAIARAGRAGCVGGGSLAASDRPRRLR
jgi:hypothetical protein